MALTADMIDRLSTLFSTAEQDEARQLLGTAVMHDNSEPGARCLRCALQASQGSLQKLRYYVGLLKIDFRDVIVAGEYDVIEHKLVKTRDLTQPFEPPPEPALAPPAPALH